MAYVPFRFFSMIDVSILMATELFPPWGTMISAYRFVGSMNCRCMGFTVPQGGNNSVAINMLTSIIEKNLKGT